MILPIYIYGSEVLRERAGEFDLSAPDAAEVIARLIPDMFETMYLADGVGLALAIGGEEAVEARLGRQ